MKVDMQQEKELEIRNNGVTFNVKKLNGQVFGRLSVNKSGITWKAPRQQKGNQISWEDLPKTLKGK